MLLAAKSSEIESSMMGVEGRSGRASTPLTVEMYNASAKQVAGSGNWTESPRPKSGYCYNSGALTKRYAQLLVNGVQQPGSFIR